MSIHRPAAFVLATAVGAPAAMVGLWILLYAGVGGDGLLTGVIIHLDLVRWLAVALGAIVGVAAATGRTGRSSAVRAGIAGALLFALCTSAIAVWAAQPEPRFDAAAFRAHPDDTEAYRAVEQRALIGLDRRALRRTLGRPHRTGPRRRLWIWELGMINDTFGPGDAGALYVRFDPRWERVVFAKVGQTS